MKPNRVLVIDDDESIRSSLKRALSYAGFHVDVAADGTAGLNSALNSTPDVVVLDVMLPDMSGLEVCRRFREAGNLPILMLTAMDEVPARVAGLESGADDYLVKPFALEELVARLRALIRRIDSDDGNRVTFADMVVDIGTHEVWRGNRLVTLTAKEFDLLSMFLRNRRQVLSRTRLLEEVWGFNYEVETHVIEVYVQYLRQKLEKAGESRLIHTIRGAGYLLKEPSS